MAHKGNEQKIRNVPAFVRSYLGSKSGERALTRNPSYQEVENDKQKGRIILGGNSLATAFHEAIVHG